MGVGPHPAVPLGGQGLQLRPQLALVGEEVLGLVASQPALQQLEVVGLGHVDGHLVGPEGALDGGAVHLFGAGPALGGAQDDHGPGGAAVVPGGPGVGLNAFDLPDGPVQGGGHGLVHGLGIIPLYKAGLPAAAPEEALQLPVGDAGENGGIVDLKPVQMEDGEHRAVPDGIEEFVPVPGGGQGTGLCLTVPHYAGGDEVGVVQHRAEGVGQGVPKLSALVDGARCLRGHMAGDTAGEGELLEEFLHSLQILADVGIDFAVTSLQIGLGHHGVAAVARAGEIDHVQVVLVDDPVQVCIDEVLTGDGAPVADNFFLDMSRLKGLLQQGVVQKVQLAGGQIVGSPPVGIQLFQLGRGQGGFPRHPGSRFCDGFVESLRFSRHRKNLLFVVYPLL